MSEKFEISEEMQEVLKTPMCVPMTEEDAKRMVGFYNKILKISNDEKANKLWKYGEQNLDFLAKDFVKKRCKGVLGDESNW